MSSPLPRLGVSPSRRVLVGLLLLAGLGAGVGVGLAVTRAPSLPVYWTLPDFRLVDQDSRPFSRRDLAGGPWIAAFIFTRCSGTCPMMTARMARLQSRLPETTLVSITVDPENDTPEVLRAYARQVGAGPRWHFLTGAAPDLYHLATDGFKLEAAALPPGRALPDEGPFVHSSKLALVDAAGRVRGYYDSTDDVAMERLAVAAQQLEGER